jgi:hypothetical protein
MNDQAPDRQAVHDELERARQTLRQLVTAATAADLRRRTSGTRWTNEQMLFRAWPPFPVRLSAVRPAGRPLRRQVRAGGVGRDVS